MLNLLLLSLNLGGLLHAVELALVDNDGLALSPLDSLFADIAKLILGQGCDTRTVSGLLSVTYKLTV